jgi:flagellar protein FlbD
MIELTKLHGQKIIVNAELIEQIEATPDTTITLSTNKRIMVIEPISLVVKKVIAYKRKCFAKVHRLHY